MAKGSEEVCGFCRAKGEAWVFEFCRVFGVCLEAWIQTRTGGYLTRLKRWRAYNTVVLDSTGRGFTLDTRTFTWFVLTAQKRQKYSTGKWILTNTPCCTFCVVGDFVQQGRTLNVVEKHLRWNELWDLTREASLQSELIISWESCELWKLCKKIGAVH